MTYDIAGGMMCQDCGSALFFVTFVLKEDRSFDRWLAVCSVCESTYAIDSNEGKSAEQHYKNVVKSLKSELN